VKDLFEYDYRGKVPAKNKGEIEMYFVNCIKSDLSKDDENRVPNDEFWGKYKSL